jgi:pyrimidine operon attenuation protein/uracil phosphoribosyltransferase
LAPDTTIVLSGDDMRRTLVRIAHEIVEKNPDGEIALVGIHRRGAHLARRLQVFHAELIGHEVPLGFVDISLYRDDLTTRTGFPVVNATELEFPLAGRTLVIVDDVLYTGRTVRAAIDEIFDYGRPGRIQLAVMVDRGHRELPFRADYASPCACASSTAATRSRSSRTRSPRPTGGHGDDHLSGPPPDLD